MGKRSDFVRVEKDFYRTIDKRAVASLQPFLVSIDGSPRYTGVDDYQFDEPCVAYAEPCFGEGDLASQLEENGHACNWASDIDAQGLYCVERDALTLTENDLRDCDVIVTNPPWSRPTLHPMIEHFSKLKPTWLLFDSSWAFTKQSSLYMKDLCTDIVAIGRLIWIPGTTMSGKDDCSWYRFDINKDRNTQFHGR